MILMYIIGALIIIMAILCTAKKLFKFAITLLIVAAIFFYGGTFIDNIKEDYGSGEILADGTIDFDTEKFTENAKQFITNINIGNIKEIKKIKVITKNQEKVEDMFGNHQETIDTITLDITYNNNTTKQITVDIVTYNKLKNLLGDKIQEGKNIINEYSN